MSKKSIILRNEKRKNVVDQYRQMRNVLKAQAIDRKLPDDERLEARRKFQSLPRNSSPVRVVNRCRATGRPRGVYARFGLGRTQLREAAMRGDIPGMVKSSW